MQQTSNMVNQMRTDRFVYLTEKAFLYFPALNTSMDDYNTILEIIDTYGLTLRNEAATTNVLQATIPVDLNISYVLVSDVSAGLPLFRYKLPVNADTDVTEVVLAGQRNMLFNNLTLSDTKQCIDALLMEHPITTDYFDWLVESMKVTEHPNSIGYYVFTQLDTSLVINVTIPLDGQYPFSERVAPDYFATNVHVSNTNDEGAETNNNVYRVVPEIVVVDRTEFTSLDSKLRELSYGTPSTYEQLQKVAMLFRPASPDVATSHLDSAAKFYNGADTV